MNMRIPVVGVALALGVMISRVWAAGDTLVGINYFSGWWSEMPNKWHGHGWTATEPDWRPRNPDRVPVLGCFNTAETMDREIVSASGHGVDFFSILWYFAAPGSQREGEADRLNRGLSNFLKSPEARRMKFLVEYCNHAEFSASSDRDWESCMRTWVEAMRHPGYLRVGGKLVFKIHDAWQFWNVNGKDPAKCRARLDALRSKVREAGLGEMLIGGGIMSRTHVAADSFIPRLFDFTATYMSIPPVQVRDQDYPYSLLAAEAREACDVHERDPVPWIPYLAAGWNPRPWTHPEADENHRRFFAFPTRAEWMDALRQLQRDFEKYPNLGLPLPGGGRQKIFTIYAWNEFGEGGIMAPTKLGGTMKLDGIRDVFGR